MWERVSEGRWRGVFYAELDKIKGIPYDFVTGPGRTLFALSTETDYGQK